VLCTFQYDIDLPSARSPHGAAVLVGSATSWLNLPTRSQSPRRCSPHGLRALTQVWAVHRRERKVEFSRRLLRYHACAEIDKTDRPATREEPGHRFSGNGVLLYQNTPLWSEHGSPMPFSALMLSRSTGKELLLDEFRLPAIWQRFAVPSRKAIQLEQREEDRHWCHSQGRRPILECSLSRLRLVIVSTRPSV
jgi:hypothetical protein